MKQILTIIAALLIALCGKDLRILTVTTTPEMHCQSCEKKIKENIRFEPGVKKIETSLEKQQVNITYDPSKTNAKKLSEAFSKIGYTVQVISDQPVSTASAKSKKGKKEAPQSR